MGTDVVVEKDVVIEKKKNIKLPSNYKVVVLNDDHTPMEFVITMLMTIFKKSQANSIALTLEIHNEGSAIAGIYSFEIAEQKVLDGINMARNNGFPLMLKAEVE
jgi:ATP-dependent Clp protease adaptor protein ClpS